MLSNTMNKRLTDLTIKDCVKLYLGYVVLQVVAVKAKPKLQEWNRNFEGLRVEKELRDMTNKN